ncbi:hypothetical protein [Oceanibium sediminis]|uniref:hypothetical protein n=1 Tax=Oceanibium sediminis TaxID=2026339 RepID=UPI000DD2F7EA|nr:hypothetical protein [Oceanibium sediminis]
MPIVVFFLILAGAIAVAILYPHLRILALGVVALFGSLAAYLFFGDYGTPANQGQRISVDELVLEDVTFVQDNRFDRLQGRVTNTSEAYRLRDFDVAVRLFDCPLPDAERSACNVVGEETGIARADVPAGQTRPFDAVLGLSQLPALKGVLVWDYEITSTRATE